MQKEKLLKNESIYYMRNTTNKIVIGSAVHAFALLIATYIIWNIPDDWTAGGSLLQKIHVVRSLSAKVDSLPDDLVLINTCYDHCMIPVYDEIGIECGEFDITDRAKLLELLKYLAKENDYRYAVIDIRFDRQFVSPSDSAFYSFLSKLPRCCIPRSSSEGSIEKTIRHLSAISEYNTNIQNNNFLKYQYLSPYGESIALRMAKDIDGISVRKLGPFFFENYKLCINSHILDIRTNVLSEYRENHEKNILQLGSDVLPLIESGEKGVFANKIIMIGDCFREDIHTTVAGPVSGMMIIYNAYHAILDENNIPALWLWAVLLLLYFIITLLILNNIKRYQFPLLNKLEKFPLFAILIEWAGFGLLFSLVGAASFFFANTYIDAWICASYFTLFDRVCSFIRNNQLTNHK